MKKSLSVILTVMLILSVLPLGLFSVTASAATEDYLTYTVSNGEATITACDTSVSGEFTIPSTLGGYPVTVIGEYAFYDCTGLTSVIIPDGVTSLEYGAFYFCESLVSVTIPDSVKTIDASAFTGCDYLVNVNITDLSAWCEINFLEDYANPLYYGADLYLNGEKLTGEVTIPNGTSKIGAYCFVGYDELTSVIIPDSVASIGEYAFYSVDLTSVYFTGTEAKWNSITASSGNDSLLSATVHFNWSGVVCDFNGDYVVDGDDAIYLLYYTLFGEDLYPVGQDCDIDGNGAVNSNDATYLLYYTLFGDEYPLYPEAEDNSFADITVGGSEDKDEGFLEWIPII